MDGASTSRRGRQQGDRDSATLILLVECFADLVATRKPTTYLHGIR
jgi:hypothetical protein